ncbi:stage III sporulation protein AF [Bacillus sp. SL00103]
MFFCITVINAGNPDHDDEAEGRTRFLTNGYKYYSLYLHLRLSLIFCFLIQNMQKYAKIVVGFLLIVVMLNPIFALFRADPDRIFSELMKGKEEAQSEEIKIR